mmetsp:Transcript_35686/g.86244  ORF Transcript_35686/g.86244 Transcript_35686/m.86244 type:complete len:265 (+) Transcript_35686:366-1160(+)
MLESESFHGHDSIQSPIHMHGLCHDDINANLVKREDRQRLEFLTLNIDREKINVADGVVLQNIRQRPTLHLHQSRRPHSINIQNIPSVPSISECKRFFLLLAAFLNARSVGVESCLVSALVHSRALCHVRDALIHEDASSVLGKLVFKPKHVDAQPSPAEAEVKKGCVGNLQRVVRTQIDIETIVATRREKVQKGKSVHVQLRPYRVLLLQKHHAHGARVLILCDNQLGQPACLLVTIRILLWTLAALRGCCCLWYACLSLCAP